jgi:hypothetical protein
LPWFRRRKSDSDVAAAPAVARPEQSHSEQSDSEQSHAGPRLERDRSVVSTTQPAAENGAAAADPTKPKRRRGSRGGRNRKKPGTTTAGGEASAEKEAAPAKPAARKPSERKPAEKKPAEKNAVSQRQERRRNEPRRRREAPRRAPLPAAKRELIVSVDVGEQRVAVLEDDRVAEVYLERPDRRSIAGNIYLGQVDNVLPGMEAAFVEIGLEKNGFLYVDEIVGPELERGHGRKIQDLISKGQ